MVGEPHRVEPKPNVPVQPEDLVGRNGELIAVLVVVLEKDIARHVANL